MGPRRERGAPSGKEFCGGEGLRVGGHSFKMHTFVRHPYTLLFYGLEVNLRITSTFSLVS